MSEETKFKEQFISAFLASSAASIYDGTLLKVEEFPIKDAIELSERAWTALLNQRIDIR